MARKSGFSKYLVWGVIIASFLGFGAFGTVSFTGGTTNIGSVGDTDIPANTYARALQTEMNALGAQTGQAITLEQARQFGITDRVLAQVVTDAALNDEAARLGLSVGDERVAEELRGIQAFSGSDGSFNRSAYAYALQNAGLGEAEFEDSLRRDAARSLLQASVLSGIDLPDTYPETLLAYIGQTRSASWATLGRDRLTTGLPVPTEDELQAWYDANIDRFTLPETRVITYAWLTPDMILDTVEVDEASLRAAYDEQHDAFNQPERRLVERLVFSDEAEAQEAAGRIASGDSDFESLALERGLALADTDMGDMAIDDLGEAGAAIFAASVGDVVGPEPSPLGPALFRVNGILDAHETSFEEAIPDLRGTLVLDRARRVIEEMAQGFDDELAGGATLEDLADTTDMELGQIDWSAGTDSGIAGYAAFRDAAQEVVEGDYPAIAELGDGGVFALRLDELRAPAPAPFEDVRAEVEALWEDEKATEALLAEAETLAGRIAAGESYEDLGLTARQAEGLGRNGGSDALPAAALSALFEMTEGEARAIAGNGEALVLRLDAVIPVDMSDDEAQQVTVQLRNQAANSIAQDLYTALTADIQSRAGVVIDQAAVNAVHSTYQ